MAARWVRGSVFIKKAVILNLFQNLPLGAFGIVVIPEEFSRGSVVSEGCNNDEQQIPDYDTRE